MPVTRGAARRTAKRKTLNELLVVITQREILTEILRYADHASLAACMRANSLMYDVAGPYQYRHIDATSPECNPLEWFPADNEAGSPSGRKSKLQLLDHCKEMDVGPHDTSLCDPDVLRHIPRLKVLRLFISDRQPISAFCVSDGHQSCDSASHFSWSPTPPPNPTDEVLLSPAPPPHELIEDDTVEGVPYTQWLDAAAEADEAKQAAKLHSHAAASVAEPDADDAQSVSDTDCESITAPAGDSDNEEYVPVSQCEMLQLLSAEKLVVYTFALGVITSTYRYEPHPRIFFELERLFSRVKTVTLVIPPHVDTHLGGRSALQRRNFGFHLAQSLGNKRLRIVLTPWPEYVREILIPNDEYELPPLTDEVFEEFLLHLCRSRQRVTIYLLEGTKIVSNHRGTMRPLTTMSRIRSTIEAKLGADEHGRKTKIEFKSAEDYAAEGWTDELVFDE